MDVGKSRHTLELRFDTFEGRPNQPIVTILINGEDVLAEGRGSSGFVGFSPKSLLDTGALIPTHPLRRVAVYRCGCGEAGCGCVAPLIKRNGDLIVWEDARDYVGVFVNPIYDGEMEWEGTEYEIPDFVFDADQYLAEVERARADRSWETDPLKTARLLGELLESHRDDLTARGYYLGWVGPHGDDAADYWVDFIGPTGQVIVALRSAAATPEERADEMAESFLAQDPSEWNIASQNDWPPDMVEKAVAARLKKVARDSD